MCDLLVLLGFVLLYVTCNGLYWVEAHGKEHKDAS